MGVNLWGESPLYLNTVNVKNIDTSTGRRQGRNCAEGVTAPLVELSVRQALGLCNRAYVPENGRIVLQGLGAELPKNERVREVFLGI